MGEKKKKHSKKDAPSADVLGGAHLALKRFRKVTKQVSKLSTGQKIVGGLAVAAAGLAYLASQNTAALATDASATPADAAPPAAARRVRKVKKID